MTDEYRDPTEQERNEQVPPATTESAGTEQAGRYEAPAAPVGDAAEEKVTPPAQSGQSAGFWNGANDPRTQTGQHYAPDGSPRPAAMSRDAWGNPIQPPAPKKKKTGLIVGISIAGVAYLVLLALVLVMLSGRGVVNKPTDAPVDVEQGERAETEPKRDNAPIVTEKGKDGKGTIVNPDYTGEVLTPAEVYKSNVDSVVYVEALFSNKKGMGSGFVIDDENGYILTNHHVVSGSEEVSVTLNNGDSYEATVIGGDEINDIAVLKVEAPHLRKVTIGDSDKIEIGSYVNIIGNPLGDLTFTITRGVIGGVARSIPNGEYNVKVFQTDAAINGGNSGGPALDDTGAVIGIASAKYADIAVEGICFCIPINDAIAVAKDLVDYGYVKGRPNFGVVVSTSSGYAYSTDPFGRRTIVETMPGAVVERIDENGCAAKAGLKVGDVITKLGDVKINSAAKLINEKLNYKAGDTVTLTVFRDEQELTLTVTLDEYKPD